MMPAALLLAALLIAAPAVADEPAAPPVAPIQASAPSAPAMAEPVQDTVPHESAPQGTATQEPAPQASSGREGLAGYFAGLAERFAAPNTPGEPGSHDLSPIGMFLAADAIVKTVMVILALLSVLTWGVWLSRLVALARGRGQLRAAYRALDTAGTLPAATAATRTATNPLGRMIAAAMLERDRSSAPGFPVEAVKARAASHLGRIEAAAARRMQTGAGLLASVASSAPFIGLFGTVWGIMNSFVGIAGSGTTSLAVVAPGIAEALLATALGLAAAIPATLFHNQVARGVAGYRLLLADAAELATRTLSRDLDRPLETPDHGTTDREPTGLDTTGSDPSRIAGDNRKAA